MRASFKRFAHSTAGGTAIEYAVIALVVSIAAVGAFMSLGNNVKALYESATKGW
jgi:Flp pilus assembly pilin Flp